MTISVLKWNCRSADAKFGDHLNKFFLLFKLSKRYALLVYVIQVKFVFFASNNLLEISNNGCCILRFFNVPSFLFDFLTFMPLTITYWLLQLFLYFLLSFLTFFSWFRYPLPDFSSKLKKRKKN